MAANDYASNAGEFVPLTNKCSADSDLRNRFRYHKPGEAVERKHEIRVWEEWKMGDYQRAQPEEKNMSWNFKYESEDKEILKHKLTQETYCPGSLLVHLGHVIDQIEPLPGHNISVKSHGHHSTYESYGDYRVERVKQDEGE